jgi:predicted CoA-binding protein
MDASEEAMSATMMDRARAFLSRRRIAVVGVSRDERDFSRMVYRELRQRGYDLVPVNPGTKELDGRPCFARLQDVTPPVEGALLLTPPSRTAQAVRDCLEAGIRCVWMHRGMGAGAADPEAMAFCEANGIEVVAGLCPFMALPGAGLPHRIHGFFRRHSLGRPAAHP